MINSKNTYITFYPSIYLLVLHTYCCLVSYTPTVGRRSATDNMMDFYWAVASVRPEMEFVRINQFCGGKVYP